MEMMMHLNLIGAVILFVVAFLSVLATTTTAHAQGASSGFHGNFSGSSHGGSVPAQHVGALSDAAYRFRGRQPRPRITRVAGVYPWNDPRWRTRLYGVPYPFYYYEPMCGFEREPYGVGKKIRWRRVFKCH
jgi:hypothetical protein